MVCKMAQWKKMFAMQAWRTEFDLSNPHKRGGPTPQSCSLMAILWDVVAHAFNPSTQDAQIGRPLRA